MESLVCFAYRRDTVPFEKLLPGREHLWRKLAQRDLRPVVSLNAEEAFQGNEALVHEPQTEEMAVKLRHLGKAALHQKVKVIVNRADRSIKVDGLPPMINENKTRSLGHRKWDTHRKVLEPLGIAMPTSLITSGKDIERFMAEHAIGVDVIVKPQIGTSSKGVRKVGRDEVPELFAQNPDWYTNYLVQPAYDVTIPLPATMRPYDTASWAGFEEHNVAGARKELRMYGFYSGGDAAIFPVARAMADGEDHWFFVDPETVPDEVTTGSEAAIKKAAEISGALALYGAVDYAYAAAGTEDPQWRVVEMNMRAPYLLGYDKHAGVADRLHELFADQIQATVQLSKAA